MRWNWSRRMEVQETLWWGVWPVCIEVVENSPPFAKFPTLQFEAWIDAGHRTWTCRCLSMKLLIEARVSSHLTWEILSWHGMLPSLHRLCPAEDSQSEPKEAHRSHELWWSNMHKVTRIPCHRQLGDFAGWRSEVDPCLPLTTGQPAGLKDSGLGTAPSWSQTSPTLKIQLLEFENPYSKGDAENILTFLTSLFFVLSHPHIPIRLRMESKMSKLQLTPFPTRTPVLQLWSGSQVVKASKHIACWIKLTPHKSLWTMADRQPK